MMEPRYLYILDYSTGTGVIIIRLSDEQLSLISDVYEENMEQFMKECLEEEYNFRTKDCEWMLSCDLNIETHGF